MTPKKRRDEISNAKKHKTKNCSLQNAKVVFAVILTLRPFGIADIFSAELIPPQADLNACCFGLGQHWPSLNNLVLLSVRSSRLVPLFLPFPPAH